MLIISDLSPTRFFLDIGLFSYLFAKSYFSFSGEPSTFRTPSTCWLWGCRIAVRPTCAPSSPSSVCSTSESRCIDCALMSYFLTCCVLEAYSWLNLLVLLYNWCSADAMSWESLELLIGIGDKR
jgi:hypothetical protein